MKMKKLFLLFIVLLTLIVSPKYVSALEKTYLDGEKNLTKEEYLKTLCKNDIEEVKHPNALSVAGKQIDLYCSFNNRDVALEKMLTKYADAISYMRTYIQIPTEINDSNWQELRNATFSIYEKGLEIPERIVYQLSSIDSFFDIYENDDVNQNIVSLVKEYTSMKAVNQKVSSLNSILNKLDEIVPNYSDNFVTIAPMFTNTSTQGVVVPMVGSSLNVAAATAYANTWASSRNTGSYYSFSNGDCTNFVSQILEASGVQQVVYNSVGSGWWHKKTTSCYWVGLIYACSTNHTHSQSWTMADTFSRYMGVTVSTTNLLTWSQGLRQGDFIALDKTNDGSWDHLGYVTDTSGVIYSYDVPDKGYCLAYSNFKVAQHTSDYNLWASNSGNGWETYTSGRYGRVRG